MQASVKPDCPHKVVTACGGRAFIKGEWRDVPAGEEKSAKANPFLDVREVQASEDEAPKAEAFKAPKAKKFKIEANAPMPEIETRSAA